MPDKFVVNVPKEEALAAGEASSIGLEGKYGMNTRERTSSLRLVAPRH